MRRIIVNYTVLMLHTQMRGLLDRFCIKSIVEDPLLMLDA